ncbi:MAG: glycosyltransferase family 39 protein [Phycisphaerales bacterium]|nr:glycosyltransferase family 39 protein [Phycisphaerales bacterium]
MIGVSAIWYCLAANRYTVFDDEAFSCRLYAMSMGDMLNLQCVGADPDPPVYYILQNAVVHFLGVGPFAIRGLSILCMLGALLTIRGAARAWFGDRAGDVALLIAACHPAHLFFGFAARWYALFLLLSTCLLWLTGRVYRRNAMSSGEAFAWGLLAALCALTNYFGLVVGGLMAITLAFRFAGRREGRVQLARLAATSVVFFAIWLRPFATHLSTFRHSSPSGSILATLARMLMALTTGNLASVGAYWVWGPMALAALLGLLLLVRSWRRVAPVAIVVVGCILVGALTRTILDKYILTFSGAACVLIAGLLTRSDERPSRGSSLLRGVCGLSLAFAWIGCAVNLATQRHWSSLRWLDPIEAAIDRAFAGGASAEAPIVATHPSVRYYVACRSVMDSFATRGDAAFKGSIDAGAWSVAYAAQNDASVRSSPLVTPDVVYDRIQTCGRVADLFAIQASGFETLPDWDALMYLLEADYEPIRRSRFLKDDDAALKDRLDPTIHHAPWRITLTQWRRRASGS